MSDPTTPINGAALQVLYERVNPTACATWERFSQIKEEFAQIIQWAGKQPSDIYLAYKFATEYIIKDIEPRLRQADFAKRVVEARGSLPLPEHWSVVESK